MLITPEFVEVINNSTLVPGECITSNDVTVLFASVQVGQS